MLVLLSSLPSPFHGPLGYLCWQRTRAAPHSCPHLTIFWFCDAAVVRVLLLFDRSPPTPLSFGSRDNHNCHLLPTACVAFGIHRQLNRPRRLHEAGVDPNSGAQMNRPGTRGPHRTPSRLPDGPSCALASCPPGTQVVGHWTWDPRANVPGSLQTGHPSGLWPARRDPRVTLLG